MAKKISIITPAYNAENFICETIKSVQQQTYTDWELLIVDDCSTDYTNVLAKDYAREDPRIRVLRPDANGGVAAARNFGLAQASGDYIAFVDSDDLWKPDKLASLYGDEARALIARRSARYFFVSCGGIDIDCGATIKAHEDLPIMEAFRSRAEKVVLLMDHTKFDAVHYYQAFALRDIDILVCDQPLPQHLREACKENDIAVIDSDGE